MPAVALGAAATTGADPAVDEPEPLDVDAVALGVVVFVSVAPPGVLPLPKIKLVASSWNGSVVSADVSARLAEMGSTVSR